MLKDLVLSFGKEKINSLTKYPSILTLHKLGEKGRLKEELTTPLLGEKMYATEKIDGTNVRLIGLGNEYLIGSREFILHYSQDLYFDNAQGIVEGIKKLGLSFPQSDMLTVVYGEFYGGKTSANAKWYGQEHNGFRVFDIALFPDLSLLEKPLEEISRWRESESNEGLRYGQSFLTRSEMLAQFPQYEYVPLLDFDLGDLSHQSILANLQKAIPHTQVALSESATRRAEGLVLRNERRSKIVKIRYEDYQKTLR